jgi:hypothetical protein
MLVAFPGTAFSSDTACSDLKAQHDRAKTALDKVVAQQMPEDKIGDVKNVVGMLQELLDSQAKDQKGVQDKIKKALDALPAADSGIVSSVKEYLKGVNGGLGYATEQAKAAGEQLDQVKDALDKIQSFFAAGDEPSAQGQIKAFNTYINNLGSATGANALPGLKDLFNAYSQGIDGIAKSAGSIEAIVTRDEKIYHDAGFEGDLYLKLKTPRQAHNEMIETLSQKMLDLENQIRDGKCDQPPEQPDPCADTKDQAVMDLKAIQQRMERSDTVTNLKLADQTADERFQTFMHATTDEDRKRDAASYSKAAADRSHLRKQYNDELGDLIDQASRNWSEADKALVHKCFEAEEKLGQTAREAKDARAKSNAKTGANATKPAEDQKCKPPEPGIIGRIDNVTDQMQGCKP